MYVFNFIKQKLQRFRESIKAGVNNIEKEWAKKLDWEERASEDAFPGSLWNQWEHEWCKTLKWDREKLPSVWEQLKNLAIDSLGLEAEIKVIKPNATDMKREVSLLLFYALFRRSYTDAFKKIEKNKKLNMKSKYRFVYLLIWAIVIHIPICLFYVLAAMFITGFIKNQMMTIELFVLGAVVLKAFVIIKNLDINRYQETWSRHTYYQYLRNQEMLRFLLQSEPYQKEKDKEDQNVDAFIKAILDIEAQNITKFRDNMDTKEKDLFENLPTVIPKAGSK